jgi:hypothetical protein
MNNVLRNYTYPDADRQLSQRMESESGSEPRRGRLSLSADEGLHRHFREATGALACRGSRAVRGGRCRRHAFRSRRGSRGSPYPRPPRQTGHVSSFTELTLAITFSAETPAEVLGAFVRWRTGEGAPELPTLEDLFGAELFDAQAYLGGYFEDDPAASLSLPERAALWRYLLGWSYTNAYFPATPATSLRWDPYGTRWRLTTRALPQESPQWVQSIITSLGEWATEGTPDRPWFAGYILDEYTPRPVLIWSAGGQPFRFEGHFESM